MKIGLIVFSMTGNTWKVAEALASSLRDGGHDAQLLRVTVASNDTKDASRPVLVDAPDPTAFDMVYFASPVQGFALAPAMLAYLRQMPAIQGKRAACFVTQHFPYRWMGGNRALRQMYAALQDKGALLTHSGVVNWSRKDRDQRVAALLRDLTAASPVNL